MEKLVEAIGKVWNYEEYVNYAQELEEEYDTKFKGGTTGLTCRVSTFRCYRNSINFIISRCCRWIGN